MARIRTIKPELPQSASLGRVSREARLCFILLFTLADDAGRLRGEPRMLASLLYPYDDDAKDCIDVWLDELHAEQCIARYTHEGQRYLCLTKWASHQRIDHAAKSKLPGPDDPSSVAHVREESRGVASPISEHASGAETFSQEGKGSEEGIKEGTKEWSGTRTRTQAPGALDGTLPRDHLDHAWCGSRFCLEPKTLARLERRYGDGARERVPEFLRGVDARLGSDRAYGGPLWLEKHFDAWLVAQGRVDAPPSVTVATAPRTGTLEQRLAAVAARRTT